MLDTLHLGHEKPMMHALLEVDVTLARRRLREHRERTGTSLSFTAFVLGCLGKAAAAHPEVHALRDWRGRLALFDDVDATVIVEVEVEQRRFALAHVVRGVERRSVPEIHDEIRAVQARGMRSLSPVVQAASRLLLSTPSFVRRAGYRAMLGFPDFAKRHTGTMLVSAVGMFGSGASFGLSAPGLHNLSVIVGGITARPSATSGDTGKREVLCLTVSANHELVDGAPLARFVRELTALLEQAHGLERTEP